MRFTPEDIFVKKGESNLATANRRWSEVIAVLEMLEEEGIVVEHNDEQIDAKMDKLESYMMYSRNLGVLE